MKGLNYKTFLNQNFFNYPIYSSGDPYSILPFKTLRPDFTGVNSDFNTFFEPQPTFAPYQCTIENTTTSEGPFSNFNISLDGYLYTGETGGVYTFEFFQLYNNDDLTFFYFGDHALSPTTSNVDQVTIFFEGTSNTFTTDELQPNTYYPILIYYGQSYGGAFLTVGIIPPGETEVNYSSDCLVTEIPSSSVYDTFEIYENPLKKIKNSRQIHTYTHEKIINNFIQ